MPTLLRDLCAGLVGYSVALPLCLGMALASNAPLSTGLGAGIIGGILVGLLSGSQASVRGPAAGLTAILAATYSIVTGDIEFLTDAGNGQMQSLEVKGTEYAT